MPEQILLQGKILGTEEFLLAGPAEGRSVRSAGEDLLAGKSQWITLLCEVLPRALLAELGLARILLGSSGGGQFLVVLPGKRSRGCRDLPARRPREQISELSSGSVKLIWARHRQPGRLGRHSQAPQRRAAGQDATRRCGIWAPRHSSPSSPRRATIRTCTSPRELGAKVREASQIGWSPENPGKVIAGRGQTYLEPDFQPFARRHHAGAPRGAER